MLGMEGAVLQNRERAFCEAGRGRFLNTKAENLIGWLSVNIGTRIFMHHGGHTFHTSQTVGFQIYIQISIIT